MIDLLLWYDSYQIYPDYQFMRPFVNPMSKTSDLGLTNHSSSSSQPNSITSQMFEISQTATKIILKTRLTENTIKMQNQKLQNQQNIHFRSDLLQDKGKYKSVRFSYQHEQRVVTIEIDKQYYNKVLNFKKYEVLIFLRTYQTTFQDFIMLLNQMRNILTKQAGCKMVSGDIFSLTLFRDFQVYNYQKQMEIKRVYIKISPFLYKRNPFIRTKQCEQFFAVVIKNSTISQMKDEKSIQHNQQSIPNDQQFFNSQRLNFIDDMYANQSLARRFALRFITFYQANLLQMGSVEMSNKYIKQFYCKCIAKCTMSATRLKKLSFCFKIPHIEKQKQGIKEKQKTMRMSIVLYCIQQYNNIKNTQFTIQIFPDQQIIEKYSSMQNLNEIFLKHLCESLNSNQDGHFVQVTNYSSSMIPGPNIINYSSKNFKILNQIGFCRVLCQFSFFMDRLIFKSNGVKIIGDNQVQTNFKDATMYFKLPVSQPYTFKKYVCNYCVEIKSSYNYVNHGILNINVNASLRQENKVPYENSVNRVIMIRKKTAKDSKDSSNTQNLYFLQSSQQLKGMVLYINQLLKKWNAYDCYYQINSFVSSYFNIVIDKNKQTSKNLFKANEHWKKIIDELSALVQTLTRSLTTPDTTLIMYILRTYEDLTRNEELTRQQILQGQQVMLMTFKYMKITQAGWIEIIPSCVYFFSMQKDQTHFYCEKDEGKFIPIKSSKQQIQNLVRSYFQKTQRFHGKLPSMFYGA